MWCGRSWETYLSELDSDARQRREIQAIQKLSQLRQEVEVQHGLFQDNLLAESRAGRESELNDQSAIAR